MIPDFPVFAPIHLSQKKEVDDLVCDHDPYSDFNFISMYCWDKGDIALSLLEGNLVVQFNDYADPKKTFLSFLGIEKPNDIANRLLDYSSKKLGVETLSLIPQATAKKLDPALFAIEEDENQHDYVYSIKEHIDLIGRKFKKRRNLHKKFIEQYGERAVVTMEQELSEDRWGIIVQLVKEWKDIKKDQGSYSEEEYEAFVRLKNCHALSDFFLFFYLYRQKTCWHFCCRSGQRRLCVVSF